MKGKKNHGRAEDQTQISLSLPKNLLDKISRLAEASERSRSNWIVWALKRKIEAEEAPKIPTPTFPSTARPPQDVHSVNEPAPTADAVPPIRTNTPAQPDITRTRRGIRGMIAKEKGKP